MFASCSPSPLSPRDPNARPRSFAPPPYNALMKPTFSSSPEKEKRDLPQRPSKYASLVKNKEKEREKRRGIFLRGVKERGDEKRWESRSEQILRTDFLSRQRQWEEEQRRLADQALAELEDEDEFVMQDKHIAEPDLQMEFDDAQLLDHMLSQEQQELEDQFASMHNENEFNSSQQVSVSDYGSDDEEYEQLFLEAAQENERQSKNAFAPSAQNNQDMDMST